MTQPADAASSSPPTGPWIMYQGWRNLLFYSWPVASATLARLLPAGLPVDEYQGSGWVTLVPFQMHDLHLRFLPPIPGTGTFPEVNLRTYVRLRGDPAVFFFSIDAASCLGALVARLAFHLPFYRAAMQLDERDGEFRMTSTRRQASGSAAAGLKVSWRPKGALHVPAAGTLEHFLLERYASYSPAGPTQLFRGPLLHSDWQVQDAEAELTDSTLITVAGLAPPVNAVGHFSPGVDTHVCPIQRVARAS